jgi:hypothetical protein
MVTKQSILNIISDPDFVNRVNSLKNVPEYQGYSDEFVKVVQLVSELYVDECRIRWKQERSLSLKNKRIPFFHAFPDFSIKTADKTIKYMPYIIRLLNTMFTLSDSEWKLLREVFTIPKDETNDPFRFTHEMMNSSVSMIITPELLHHDENRLYVIWSNLGVALVYKEWIEHMRKLASNSRGKKK